MVSIAECHGIAALQAGTKKSGLQARLYNSLCINALA
jgi:hypothetical protein